MSLGRDGCVVSMRGLKDAGSERCSHVAVIRNVATVFRPKAESGEWEKEREGGEKKEETRGKQNK